MKFLFYYALKEMKGYFLRHFCIFLHISIYFFAIITLQGFILGIGRDSESSQLVLFSVILCTGIEQEHFVLELFPVRLKFVCKT